MLASTEVVTTPVMAESVVGQGEGKENYFQVLDRSSSQALLSTSEPRVCLSSSKLLGFPPCEFKALTLTQWAPSLYMKMMVLQDGLSVVPLCLENFAQLE